MDTLFSNTNLIALFATLGTALLGLLTYRSQKKIEMDFKKEEIKRAAITTYLCSLESLINHAAYSKDQDSFDEAAEILKCKENINRIYIYAPGKVAEAMDSLLSEAIALATIISKIPNDEIFKEDQVARYSEESERTHKAYLEAINFARKEVGLHTESVNNVQMLLLGAKS